MRYAESGNYRDEVLELEGIPFGPLLCDNDEEVSLGCSIAKRASIWSFFISARTIQWDLVENFLEVGEIPFGPLLSRDFIDQPSYPHSSLKTSQRTIMNILGGAVGGWSLAWATAYVLSDIHFIPLFSMYFSGCYLMVCLLFLLLASSSSSPISLRTFLAGLGLMSSVMCLLLQRSIRHFIQTRKLGLYWSPFLRDLFDSVLGGVVSVTCLLSAWACVLMCTKCCIPGGTPWPSGAQVLFASCAGFAIGSSAGLEFGHKLTEYPRLNPGGLVSTMWESLLWQSLGACAGMSGTIFARELVPRWRLRAPIDAEMESLSTEFGPASLMQLIFATASAPVASILGRVQPPFFSENRLDAEMNHILQDAS